MIQSAFFIAKRYYLSGKNFLLINIISLLSMLVIALVTLSLIIILSVFNGMEDLIRSLFNTFDSEICIKPKEGKSFLYNDTFKSKLNNVKGVEIITEVIEDYAVVSYKNENDVVLIKGVSNNFVAHQRMDSFIVQGKFILGDTSQDYAIIGRGIQYKLSIALNNTFNKLVFYYPNKSKIKSPSSLEAFNSKAIQPGGVFAIEKQYDDQYIFVPLEFAKELMSMEDYRTQLEIKVKEGFDLLTVRDDIKSILGENYLVLSSDEQHIGLLRAIRTEKLIVTIMLILILGIASVGIFFCLTMLTLNKQKDIAILKSMGASEVFIKRLFILEGVLISTTGAILGVFLGTTIVWLQEQFQWIEIGNDTSVVPSYPVDLQYMDVTVVFLSVLVISILVSLRPAIIASKVIVKDTI
jgi:lipoprotein-releasing system permease protein